MGNAETQAREAQELLDNETFQDVVAQIKQEAIDLFLTARGDSVMLSHATQKVAAYETFLGALKGRIDNWAVEKKRQDRLNGD